MLPKGVLLLSSFAPFCKVKFRTSSEKHKTSESENLFQTFPAPYTVKSFSSRIATACSKQFFTTRSIRPKNAAANTIANPMGR